MALLLGLSSLANFASVSRWERFLMGRPRRPRNGDCLASGRRDSGIRRKLISSVSAGLKGEPDKGDLQGQSDPGEHFGHLVAAVLGGYGGLQVGRPDDHQENRGGDPSPPVPAPKPDRADELDDPARVDQFGRARQNMRNKSLEDGWVRQVDEPADREEGCDSPRAIPSQPMLPTTACVHRLTLRPVIGSRIRCSAKKGVIIDPHIILAAVLHVLRSPELG